MVTIGIAGGVASGKSLVAAQLAELGAAVFDADQAGHEVLRDPEVVHAARRRWGAQAMGPDGQIDRRFVASQVFGTSPEAAQELAFWESWTHPRITARMRSWLEQQRKLGRRAAVLDAAVMFRAGWDRACDQLVFVETPRATRRARAAQRGWTAAELQAREAAQLSLEEKRRRATIVIDNSGDIDQTYEQVRVFWNSLSI